MTLCPDPWGQCTHHPTAANMGCRQLTAAPLTVHFPGPEGTISAKAITLTGGQLMTNDRLIQGYKRLVPSHLFGTTEEPSQLQNSW